MAYQTIQTFKINSLSILDNNGNADPQLDPKLDATLLRSMFRNMLQTREFDLRSINLQRQGRMGTYAPSTGQEATVVGSATAMKGEDWAVPSFREQGVYLSRGISATLLFLFFMGSEEGNRISKNLRTLPYCVPCATQLLHAVGIGMASQIKNEKNAVVTYLGDGATSEGDFHEAINFAGVYQAPVVFICQNNRWAISTPLQAQTHSESIAQKAIAYGVEGLQVDGNDILAVYQATQEALQRAKQGKGPTLLECMTYRLGVHTTSDDPHRYRDDSEVEAWKLKDPIDRFEKYLIEKNILAKNEREVLTREVSEELIRATEEAEKIINNIKPEAMFDYLYETLPPTLQSQRDELLKRF